MELVTTLCVGDFCESAMRCSISMTSDDPVIRKASAHGLGHLLAPGMRKYHPGKQVYPTASENLSDIGVIAGGSTTFGVSIIEAALDGHPNQVPLDYHPALTSPALSRYGATSPDLLCWMKLFNEGRDYSDQVKPFGSWWHP